jgi:asparagine synthase (glutamine-hydrolysing)
MCGIAGLWTLAGPAKTDPAGMAERMAEAVAHRGPDGYGAWGDPAAGIGLSHRRLSIIDLSETGAQPMHSASGRYVITYNGEVYNFGDLRKELAARGHTFRGTSDTEVMLAACEAWGPEAAVKRFVGMFAFALFDRQERTLRLVRDRLGVKPLYWTITEGTLLFGSELRALMAHPNFKRDVDVEAIDSVVRLSYVPTPATIFKNVHKLPPASILTLRSGGEPTIARYWNVVDVANQPQQACGEAEAVDALDALLRDAISRRLISDVPLGAFLSGGTDSSAVVALMQQVSDRRVQTYTVATDDARFDESAQARAVANHLGTNHTEIKLDPTAMIDQVGNIPEWFDEPFADASQLPTHLVAKSTRAHVTVALSGDGGDELFAGYPKYDILARTWRYATALPKPARIACGKLLSAAPGVVLQRFGSLIDPARGERIEEKARRLGAALSADSLDDAAIAIAIVGLDARGLVRGAEGTYRVRPIAGLHTEDVVSRMQVQDMMSYLPDDILTKVDRCTMAVALEAREPLLDHRLIEFLWSLPPAVRRGDGTPKFLLRKVLARYLPVEMIDRPKRGFSIPVGEWLAGPWRAWAESLLDAQSLARLFDAPRVRTMWQRHLAGVHDNATTLWNILMIQAWARRWL